VKTSENSAAARWFPGRQRRCCIAAVGLVALLTLAAGCARTRPASARERERVTQAVQAYVEKLRELPQQDRERLPQWLAGAREVEVIEVEKKGETFRALVRLSTPGGQATRYFLLRKQKGRYRVAGVL